MGVIFILILILLIPAAMVQGLIHERMMTQQEAIEEVSSKHARQQNLSGPILTIPYEVRKNVTGSDGKLTSTPVIQYYHILPERLDVTCDLIPEKRKRGIYEVVVYDTKLKYEGVYKNFKFEQNGIRPDQLQLDKAFITLGITDLKGLSEQVKINFNDSNYYFNPGVQTDQVVSSGLNVPVVIDSLSEAMKFNYSMNLKGSESLMFAPIGKETKVTMKSDWKDPSFNGTFLPDSRKVGEDGFEAVWKVLHLNRNYPQEWSGNKFGIYNSQFGVDLKLPVDIYQKSMRVAKYALLFIVLTFLVFFFVEIMNKILIHPIQYILVGIALVLFYVLLLAFSEQIYFNWAYVIASLMTIILVTMYCRSILKSWGLAIMTGSILIILYGFIFILIQLQDYALLFGSLGVFLILAVTMYFSRKIDWFDLKKEDKQEAMEA